MATSRRFSFTRTIGLLVLGALVLMVVRPVFAQQQVVNEYPIRGYQTNQYYKANMLLVLQRLGNGTNQWVIPARSSQSYNDTAGNFTSAEGFYTVYGTPGAGACDVATWLFHVAKDSGILNPSANRLDHPAIPGVPAPYVTIWDPGSDLVVENPNDYQVVIKWDLDSNPGYIRLWVEQNGEPVVPKIESTPVVTVPETQPLVKSPFDPIVFVQNIRWDLIGYLALVFAVIVLVFRDRVIRTAFGVYRNRHQIRRIHELALKESLQYWAVLIVGMFILIPDMQRGFDTWLYGYTTIKNTDIALFLSTLLLTLYLKNIRRVRLEREYREGKPYRKPWIGRLIGTLVIIGGILFGVAGYEAPKAAIAYGDCAVSAAFPQGVYRWCTLITREAAKNGVDPDLVAALILQESSGNPKAYSSDGAVGLMQVMPRDGIAGVKYSVFSDRPSMAELYDPEFNIMYGTRMLAALIKADGTRDALKAYGPAGVGYYYADIVLGLYDQYKK